MDKPLILRPSLITLLCILPLREGLDVKTILKQVLDRGIVIKENALKHALKQLVNTHLVRKEKFEHVEKGKKGRRDYLKFFLTEEGVEKREELLKEPNQKKFLEIQESLKSAVNRKKSSIAHFLSTRARY